MSSFGETVRNRRLDSGKSQGAVAAALHRSVSYVSGVERGKRAVPLRRIPEWASVLGLGVEDLVTTVLQKRLDDAALDYVVTVRDETNA